MATVFDFLVGRMRVGIFATLCFVGTFFFVVDRPFTAFIAVMHFPFNGFGRHARTRFFCFPVFSFVLVDFTRIRLGGVPSIVLTRVGALPFFIGVAFGI